MGKPDPLIGQPIFGGYLVTRRIGAGGMGAVYLLENVELGKKLAAKVLLPSRLESEQLTKRFLAEARAASAIRHRNIIEIIDSAQLPDGRHYILMEHLEGDTLRGFVKQRGRLSPPVVLAVLAQVAAGLQAAHDRGIVHRDLKPSNIFISPQPDNPYFAKILDFGIAKLDDPNLAGDLTTKSQSVAGTPNYMSPEQARAMKDVDQRTDLYAVGVMAFELLTGRLPYYANSVGDLVYQQTSDRPPAPRDYAPDVPAAWNDLIMQSIAYDREQRPSSARALADLMIAATPDGDRIARAAAPLLFGNTSLPDVEPVRALVPSWSEASLPDGAADRTASLATPSATEAASPAALRGSQPAAAPTPAPVAAPDPTTLGESASEVSSRIDIGATGRRRFGGLLIGGALVLGAAAVAAALLVSSGRSSSEADDEATEELRPAAAGEPERPIVEAIDEPAPVDAGAAEEPTDERAEPARTPSRPKRSKTSRRKQSADPPDRTGDTESTPTDDPDDLFEHRK